MPELRVELYGEPVGTLRGADWRTFDFTAEPAAIGRLGLGNTMLSLSVPLVPFGQRGRAARRRNFFAELLPEGDLLTEIAAQARLPEYDVLGLLARYGRDVAGALQIYDPAAPGEPRTPYTTPVTDEAVARLLADPAARPLGNEPASGKTSLNGVQPKIVLARVDDRWCTVHDGYPSTHIVKPVVPAHPTMIYDEEYGARIARALDLLAYDTWIEDFGGSAALVIERYDRAPDAPSGRVHQEDLCQALGVPRTRKYQEQGGTVTLDRIEGLLREHAAAPSIERFAIMTVLAVAIGNVDMHAKNLAVLHPLDRGPELAPAYDVVPLRHRPNDGRLALAVNGVYRHDDVTIADLEAQIRPWMTGETDLVRTTLERIGEIVSTEDPLPGAHEHLRADILGFVENLLADKPAGAPR